MERTIVFADLKLTVTLVEDEPNVLTVLSDQEFQVLTGLLYLSLNTFSVTRALFCLDALMEKKDKDCTTLECKCPCHKG